MHYTVASTRDYNGMMCVDFTKVGNKYMVEFTSKGRQETTRKKFDRIGEAVAVYQKFVEAFITGCYSYEDRKQWLVEEEANKA